MLCLIRHGETEWSHSGRHTGLTDLPLTADGARCATAVGAALAGRPFARVWTSPLQRARRTCELAGFAVQAVIDDRLVEWDYGDYEGLLTSEIRQERPGWSLFRDGCPGGESVEQAVARAASFLQHAGAEPEGVLIFSSGHFLRLLTTVWLGCDPQFADHLPLGTGSISRLEHDVKHGVPALQLWNHQPSFPP